MQELTFEVDDFGKPLLHSTLNSVVMQMYSILLNKEDRAYPNQAIGIGFMDYVGTVITDASLQQTADDLLQVIGSLISGVVVQDVNISVVRDNSSVVNTIDIATTFTYVDGVNVKEGTTTYRFTNSDGNITSHIFV